MNSLPLPVIGIGLALMFVLASFAGNRVWAAGDRADTSDINFIVAGTLGLQALLIGFTFAVALDRYATRRDLVVTEANAIEAAWLRVDLLPPVQAAPMKAKLRDYAVSRLRFHDAGTDPALIAAAHAEADRRQAGLWEDARTIVEANDNSVIARGILDTTGELIQVAARREAAARANIPPAVIRTLLLFAIIASAILGYASGNLPRRHRVVGYALFVLLALAVSTILDLDRPRRGSIQVSQQPMTDLLKRIDLPPPARTASPPPGSRSGSLPAPAPR